MLCRFVCRCLVYARHCSAGRPGFGTEVPGLLGRA
ncbi:hypothetical protein EVA_03828 [gut metagenome]|uniref:Uncharacterized protein n=1 Tax=gut metagenome TaxID=749906 RepID=J9GY60_9ZZZZ